MYAVPCVCFDDCLLAKKRQTTDNKTKTGIERIIYIYFRLYCVRHAPRIQSIISPGRARFQIRAIVVIFGSANDNKNVSNHARNCFENLQIL